MATSPAPQPASSLASARGSVAAVKPPLFPDGHDDALGGPGSPGARIAGHWREYRLAFVGLCLLSLALVVGGALLAAPKAAPAPGAVPSAAPATVPGQPAPAPAAPAAPAQQSGSPLGWALLLLGLGIPVGYVGYLLASSGTGGTRAWTSARGFRPSGSATLRGTLPLLKFQHDRRYPFLATGRLGTYPAIVGFYECWDIDQHSWGNEDMFDVDRKEHRRSFAVAQVELPDAVAQRFDGFYLSERASHGRTLLRGALLPDHPGDEIQVSDEAFTARYELRVAPYGDDAALQALLTPGFVAALAALPAGITLEQRGRELLAYCTGSGANVDALDTLSVIARFASDAFVRAVGASQ